MLVRLAQALYLLVVVAMIAFYAVSAGNSAPAQTSARRMTMCALVSAPPMWFSTAIE